MDSAAVGSRLLSKRPWSCRRYSRKKMPMLILITTMLGTNRRRRNVHRSRGNVDRTMMLMGLLTGSKNEAVSAMKVQAKRYGKTGNLRRVVRLYTIGVKMRAVASLEKNMEIRLPRRKVFKKSRRALLPERLVTQAASQSKNPAVSASAERLIMPRKKKNVFQSCTRVKNAFAGVISPRRMSSPAPARAMMASFVFQGRNMTPT